MGIINLPPENKPKFSGVAAGVVVMVVFI